MNENIIEGSKVSQSTLNHTNQSFGEYLVSVSLKHRSKTLMFDAETEESLTVKNVLDRSYKFASLLMQKGCSKDSVVAIYCENSLEFPSLLLATLQIGATCTCVNPLYSTNELLHALTISKPKLVFTSSKNYDKVKAIQIQCSFLENVVNVNADDLPEFDENFQFDPVAHKAQPDDTAIILYSSGTTGLSKGVMLSHRSFIFLMEIYRTEKLIEFPEDNVISGILPMSHAYGLFSLLLCLVLGHKYILIKRYHDKLFLSYIETYKINTLHIVPSIVIFLAKDIAIDEYDLSSVKIISCGGGALRLEIEKDIKRRFKCTFLQHYGMTETTAMNLYSLPSSKIGVTGRLLPGMIAKIVDQTNGTTLGPHEKGEYCVKGHLLMKGYCSGATVDSPIDNEGWLHTGDIGYYDDDHDFFIIERIKELIKYKGYQVPPVELEMLILQNPDVIAVGVVGLPDELAGELPRAYVVKKIGSRLSENDILNFVTCNISPMKKLRGGVKFVNHLPKTVSGKIDRKELKKWATLGL